MAVARPVVRRNLIRVLVAAPAVLLTAWWVRSYFVNDWWGVYTPGDSAVQKPEEKKGLRSSAGGMSWWHVTADVLPPGDRTHFVYFSDPIDSGSKSSIRPPAGWAWETTPGRLPTAESRGPASNLSLVGFDHYQSRAVNKDFPERSSEEAWLWPYWAMVVPAWILCGVVFRRLRRPPSPLPIPPSTSS